MFLEQPSLQNEKTTLASVHSCQKTIFSSLRMSPSRKYPPHTKVRLWSCLILQPYLIYSQSENRNSHDLFLVLIMNTSTLQRAGEIG